MDYPFLFHSNSEAKYLLNSLILQEIEPLSGHHRRKMSEHLVHGLAVSDLQRTDPYTTGSGWTESASHVYGKPWTNTIAVWGAIPIKMNYNDVKDALHAGIIECQENPYSNTLGMKFYEEQTYITRLKYYLSTEALYVSKNTLEQVVHRTAECNPVSSPGNYKLDFSKNSRRLLTRIVRGFLPRKKA